MCYKNFIQCKTSCLFSKFYCLLQISVRVLLKHRWKLRSFSSLCYLRARHRRCLATSSRSHQNKRARAVRPQGITFIKGNCRGVVYLAECVREPGVLTALRVEDPLNWAAQLSIGYIITQIPGPYSSVIFTIGQRGEVIGNAFGPSGHNRRHPARLLRPWINNIGLHRRETRFARSALA